MPCPGSYTGLRSMSRLLSYAMSGIMLLLPPAAAMAQRKSTTPTQKTRQASPKDTKVQGAVGFEEWDKKYPGLLDEFSRLLERLQDQAQASVPHSQGQILKRLPESTVFYLALPNYGDAVHRALGVFHEELQRSEPLRDWWRDTAGADGRKFEDGADKFSQLAQYLGDEVVISSSAPDQEYSALLMAEIRKPGLRDFIAGLNKEYAGKTPVRVFDPQQLAAEKNLPRHGDPVVLIRSDLVIAALDAKVLRNFSAGLGHNTGMLSRTDFGQRLSLAHQNKASVVAGANLQKIIKQVSAGNAKTVETLRQTGFADAKYAIWEVMSRDSGQTSVSSMELSFTGPRQGPASWLANSGALGALDFMSPEPTMVYDLRLKNPAKIFDELREILSASGPGAFATLDRAEQGMNLSIRNDLLAKLGGEIGVEMGTPKGQIPTMKLLLSTNDAAGLQATLEKLMASSGIRPNTHTDTQDGVTSYSLHFPAARGPQEVHYAFIDNYFLLTLDQEELTKAVQMHRTGTSLARAQALRDESSLGASGVVYNNMAQALAPALREAPPEYAQLLSRLLMNSKPTVMHLYGDDSAIRLVTSSGSTDPSMVLVVAAVAIPNFLRARISANEAAAASTVRTVNVAQVTYASSFPSRGFARDLASLGPGEGDCVETSGSEEHACLLDTVLANSSCTSGIWCAKGQFRYSVTATCAGLNCRDYVVVATPVTANAGQKSFCSVSDAVIRSKPGPPLTRPVSAAECRSWSAVH